MSYKKIAFHTLGCKLNFTETSAISHNLPGEKFRKVSPGSSADIHFINTCTVTESADKKCRQLIKKLIKQDPDSFIIAAGCYAQLNPEKISSIKGVDLILGNNEKFNLEDYLDSTEKKQNSEIYSCELSDSDNFFDAWSAGDRTRSFLKVQDGCDYICSYCTIPKARGKSRNPHISVLVTEAEMMASEGIKEIVFTGVNIGDFGKSTGETLTDLIKELVKVDGIDRYRISSIEPNLLTDEIIKLVSEEPKIMPHFHIPLQNGNNRILGLMKRRYKREVFADRVMRIKELIPYAGIGADIIVGFPGEREEDFEDTYSFIKSLPLSYLHVFPFSERTGTTAAELTDKVRPEVKERRCGKLLELSRSLHKNFMLLNIGRFEDVLFEESRSKGMITGLTSNYLRVELPWDSNLAGNIKRVKILEAGENDRIRAEIVSRTEDTDFFNQVTLS